MQFVGKTLSNTIKRCPDIWYNSASACKIQSRKMPPCSLTYAL